MGSKLKIYPSFLSTISRIQTTLSYLPLFPVSIGDAVEIVPERFPTEVIVLGGVVLAIGVIVLWGNYPTGVMVQGG